METIFTRIRGSIPIAMSIRKFLYNKKSSGLSKITDEQELHNRFTGNSIDTNSRLAKAYEKAWDARKFEIDNYWKRTTYFWAFQITAFTAYLAILNSTAYTANPSKNPEILFCVISIGFITAMSWSLINIGSKFWQRHWEKYIDILEDQITGPLYKTIYAHKSTRTFSVSKINEMISRFFVFIWLILGVKYFQNHLSFYGTWADIAYIEAVVTLLTVTFTFAMFNGYGRGNFGSSDFEYYSRKVFK
jgi:hypothetical protein